MDVSYNGLIMLGSYPRRCGFESHGVHQVTKSTFADEDRVRDRKVNPAAATASSSFEYVV